MRSIVQANVLLARTAVVRQQPCVCRLRRRMRGQGNALRCVTCDRGAGSLAAGALGLQRHSARVRQQQPLLRARHRRMPSAPALSFRLETSANELLFEQRSELERLLWRQLLILT